MNSNNYNSIYSSNRISKLKTAVLLAVLMFTSVYVAHAQLTNVPVTGYNNDIIANGVGATNTATTGTIPGVSQPTIGVDGNGPGAYSFVDNTYKWYSGSTAATCGIPATIASLQTSGLTYVTQSASANNALTVQSNTYTGSVFPTTGAVTLSTPASYTKLYVLYESVLNTSGPTITATVTFTDASTQVFPNITVVNWFTNTLAAWTNNQRAQNAAPGAASTCGSGPYLFETPLTISPANYGKLVQSISFNWSNAVGNSVNTVDYLHVMAIGGLSPCTTPVDQALALTQGVTTASSIAGSFTAAPSSPTGYLVLGCVNGTPVTPPVNGTTYVAGQFIGACKVVQVSNATSFTATGLFGGTNYDVRVYSYNSGATCGGPQYNLVSVPTQTWATSTCAGVAGGTYSVGPTGIYSSITAALTAINAGISGPVILELQPTYVSSVETFPITFPSNSCIGPINTLTIRPEAGATALAITSNNTTGTINFNAANFITIDGRPGGVGTTSQLTIANTNAGASYATQFINDANNNTIKYCTVTSRNTSATSGSIVFLTGSVNGNDNNTIDNCNITDDGNNTTFPANGIYSAGTSAAIDNSNNVISNCNISNYYSATLATNGVLLTGTGNSTWTISNNKLFQTATRLYTTGNNHNGISIGTGSGYTITGNTIGFSNSIGSGTTNMVGATAAIAGFPGNYAAGTGVATTYTGINATFTSLGVNSLIQGNTIAGFALFTSTGGGGAFTGINVATGNVTIGGATAILGNTIGSTSGLSSIYLASTATGGAVFGIRTSPAANNTATVQNNTIGAIDAMGTSATLAGSFVGIDGSGAGIIVHTNNTVGNTTADNIRSGYTTLSGVTATNLSNVGLFVAAGTTGTTGTMSAIRSTNTGNLYNASSNIIRGFAMNATVSTGLAITASGTMTGAASIIVNNNQIGTAALGWIRYVAANSGALTGIAVSNTVALAYSIQNNDFQGIVHSTAGSSAHTYINLTGATSQGAAATIANNTFTNLNVNTTGSVTFISHNYTVGVAASQLINNNAIVTAFNKTGAGGTVTCMTSASSTISALSSVIHTNNNFSNITVTGATTLNGIANTDGTTATAINRTINNNTFNNWVGGTSAITVMNYAYWGGTTSTLSSNTITNITGQSSITAINIGNSGLTANPLTIASNTITNITSTGTGGAVIGIACANASPVVNIGPNSINTLASTGTPVIGLSITGGAVVNNTGNSIKNLSSSNASGVVTGVNVTAGTTVTINGDTIGTLSASGATSPIVNGIVVSGGTTVNLTKNKIYDLSASAAIATTAGAINGIAISAGTSVNVYNNLIGDLRAPLANLGDAIRGISVTSAATTTSYNLYFNTIYINATSTGAVFGTTGIFHTANATATTAKLDLRNNIVINISTANGAGGVTSVLRRSAAATYGNYATTSNNNYFYAGVPSATNAIMNDNGTVYGTAAAGFAFGPVGTAFTFQNIVNPREGASRTGEGGFTYSTAGSFFQSLTGSSANFLHIVNAITTLAESGAQTITTPAITDDYDAQVRNVLTPDIGADEFNGTSPAPAISAVTITPSGTQCVATNRLVSATITTPSGTITGAVLNYSYNGTVQSPITMTFNVGTSKWEGTIPAATTPVNATVAWSITGTNDAPFSTSVNGTSYSDVPNFGLSAVATSTASTICAGVSTTLSVAISGGGAPPVYTAPPAVTNPTTDEDFGNITITQGATTILNNTTAGGSLAGTIGIATGTAGSYSNFTAFGPYNLVPGTTYNCSLTSITQGGNFGNALAIYIDYNRNGVFNDAGENVYNQGATISGPHTSTGSFTVPANASIGTCRMRVAVNEGTITSPTQTFSWGEYEEYTMMIAPPVTAYSWDAGAGSFSTSSSVIVNPITTTTYTATLTANSCPIASNPLTISVNPLPSAPTVTSSSQCGIGIPLASATSTSGIGAPGPQLYWYSAPTGGTLLQTPPVGGSLSTYYSNDFSSATLTNSSLGGAASIATGILSLQPTTTSSGGSITVNASGINSNLFQTDFDLSLIATGTTIADGFSYSIGDDAVPSYNTAPTAEHGSGSKIRIGFFTYNTANGSDGKGIYLGYGVTATSGYTAATPGMLAYSTNVSWIPVAAGTLSSHITVSINAAGQLTLMLGATTIFSNVQLPAGYLAANKSTWKHIFSSRSGGVAGGYTMDNLVIQANSYGPGYTTYQTAISATTPFYITEKNPVTGCESSPRALATATVTYGDAVNPTASISSLPITGLCIGNTFQLSLTQSGGNNNAYTYTWSGSSSNSGITGTVSGGVFGSPATLNITPLVAGTYTYTVTYSDGLCNGVSTINITTNPLPVITSATANPNPICNGTSTVLTALTGTPAGNQFQETFESFPGTFVQTGTGVSWAGSNTYYIQGTGSAKSTYAASCDGSLAMTTSVSLVGLPTPQLKFWHICASENSFDYGRPEYSIDGGANWIGFPVAAYAGAGTLAPNMVSAGVIGFQANSYSDWSTQFPSSAGVYPAGPATSLWKQETINLAAYSSATNFRVRFRLTSDPSVLYAGWSIDDVRITYASSSGAGTLNWVWTPGPLNGNTVSVSPSSSSIYTVTATNPATSCSSTATVGVTVNPLPLAPTTANSPSTQCGYAAPAVAVADPNSFVTPTFNWYSAATGGTLLQSSTSTTYTTVISTTTNFWVSVINPTTGCESPRLAVVANVTPFDPISITANALTCVGTPNAFGIVQTGNTNVYQYTWTASPVSGSGVTGTPTGSNPSFTASIGGNYVYSVTGTETGTGCVAKASKSVTVYQGLTGTLSATQITSCTNPTGLITANVSGAGTVVNNDFSSNVLPSNMTSAGTGFAITGGQMQLTPALNGYSGGVLISNPTGLANNDFQIDFDMITTTSAVSNSPADGFSYSYGDDVVALPTGTAATGTTGVTTLAPENGSGTKLKLSFDAINNTGGCTAGTPGTPGSLTSGNVTGVYLMYNSTTVHQGPTCPGVIYFDGGPSTATYTNYIAGPNGTAAGTGWRATTAPGSTTHVTIKINALGQVSLWLNNIQVVFNQQLPASYLSANKATWKHAFCARTGGLNQGHYIDNLLIQYNNFYEYSIDTGATWSTTNPIVPPNAGTYSVDARYVSVPGCFTNLGTVTINTPVFTTSATANSSCVYSTSQPTLSFTPSFAGATYQWDSASVGLNNWAPIAGATNATYTLPFGMYLNSTDFRCRIFCGGTPISGSPTTRKSILVYTPLVTSTNGATRCGIGTVTLSATGSPGTVLNWYTVATGGSPIASAVGPIAVTGFNNDIVAGGVGSNTVSGRTYTFGVDGAGYSFMNNTFQYNSSSALPVCFLPTNKLIPSLLTGGLTYQLQDYGVGTGLNNNAMSIANASSGSYTSPLPSSGTLSLVTPASYSTLKVLYESVINTSPLNVDATVTFTDATTQFFPANACVNWFTATSPAYSGSGRVTPTGGSECGAAPYLFELSLPIGLANQTKQVASITFSIPTVVSAAFPYNVNYFHAMAVGGSLTTPPGTFTTPIISTTTTYYVDATTVGSGSSGSSTVGLSPTSSACGTIASSTLTDWPIRFDVAAPLIINTVDVIPSVAGTFVVALRNSLSSTDLQTATFNFTSGQIGVPQTLSLGFSIATTGSYQLTNSSGGGYRISTFTCNYPYTSPSGNFSIVGSATTSASTTNTTTYNIFYNINISEGSGGCQSPRIAVVATVTPAPPVVLSTPVTICQSDNTTLTAVSATNDPNYTYTWNPGGFVGANYTVSPAATTTYTLTAVDNSGGVNNTCQDIKTVTVSVNQRPTISSLTSSTPVALCQGDSSQITLVAAPYQTPTANYSLTSIPYATQPTTGFTTVTGLTDDNFSSAITLPFSFNFYGVAKTSLIVESNGYLNLSGTGSGDRFAQVIPSTTTPNNYIALCYADLLPSSGGTISYGTVGFAPNRIFVVDWNGTPFYNLGNPTGNVSGQIWLYENGGRIEVHVSSINHGVSTVVNTLGIENTSGALGTAPSTRNGVLWDVTTPEAWRFSTPSNTGLTYAWTPTSGLSNSAIQNPKASPNSNANYTVVVSEPSTGCSRSASIGINVTPKPKPYVIGQILRNVLGDTAVCSTDLGFVAVVKDSGAYANGYPAGTTFEWVGITSSFNTDSTLTIDAGVGSIGTNVIVKLPLGIGGCNTSTSVVNVDFGSVQTQQVTLTTDTVRCKGESTGKAIATVSFGGTPDFHYQWYNSQGMLLKDVTKSDLTDTLSGQPIGMYYITVSDHQGVGVPPYCSVVDSVEIFEPSNYLAISAVKTNPSSSVPASGTITTTTTGGTMGYYYLWNDGATTKDRTNILGGTYTVVVTDDHGCTASTSITLTYECSITATNVVVQQASCFKNNGVMTVIPSGGTGYSYHWYTSPVQTTATGTGLAYGYNSYCLVKDTISGCSFLDTVITPTSAGLSIAMTPSVYSGGKNIRCYGDNSGSITTSVTGSSGPYSYVWSNSVTNTSANISGLVAGTYTVTVSNGGCTSSNTIILYQPAAIVAVTSSTNSTCGVAGTASVAVSGGTAPYNYSWNTIPVKTTASVTGLAAGTYIVTVSDVNGCTKSGTVVITAAVGFPITGVITNVKCYGGSTGTITITTGGGIAPYTYLWSNGSINKNQLALAAGTYTVTATDSKGCSGQYSGTVTQPPLLVLVVGSVVNVSCNLGTNGSATVTASGGTPAYAYSWNTVPVQTTATATGLKSGTYMCTVTDANACVKIISVTITQPALLSVTVTKVNVTVFGGANGSATAVPSGGTSPFTYLWSNTKTTQTITGLVAGTYIVTVTDSKGCTKTGSAVITQPASRTSDGLSVGASNSVVFPNPSSGKTTVSFDETIRTKVSLEVFSMKGERVFEKEFSVEENSNSFDLDLTRLPKGVYSIRYRTNDKDWIDKLVIQ